MTLLLFVLFVFLITFGIRRSSLRQKQNGCDVCKEKGCNTFIHDSHESHKD